MSIVWEFPGILFLRWRIDYVVTYLLFLRWRIDYVVTYLLKVTVEPRGLWKSKKLDNLKGKYKEHIRS